MKYSETILKKNDEESRFEMEVEGHTAFVMFEFPEEKLINLYHTEVPPALEGKGVAFALIEKTLQYCRDHQWRVLPTCPFVSAFVKRHPEWQSITIN